MRETRALGATGWIVKRVGLGGMPMSIQGRPDRETSMATLRAAFEEGFDFVDTADVYCLDDGDLGHNEALIRDAIREHGGGRTIRVATKAGCTRPNGAWGRDARPEHVLAACDRSLLALGAERIDLYQLHAPDPAVPFAESVGAFAELQRRGKIAHFGLSNVSVEQIRAAREILPVVSVQNRCNPYDLRAFRDGVASFCADHGIAFLPYSPVGGSRGVAKLRADPALQEVGRRHGATAPEIAVAWLLAKCPVAIPIPGASRPESARSSARANDLSLPADDVAALDRAFGL